MSATRRDRTAPWTVVCDLCERTTIELPASDEDALGDAIRAEGWTIPVYGGTFEPKCWATMRRINNR